jgi:prepilin-type N-terminal cleavage/methylation domain-containing protein/prepilin-type processing-associated H-X9-DG protein
VEVSAMRRAGLSMIELIAVIVILAILGAIMLPALSRARFVPHPSCQNYLKQHGLVAKMYANESPGNLYPPLQVFADGSESTFEFTMSMQAVYPEYMTDAGILTCPKDDETDWMLIGDDIGAMSRRAGKSYTYYSHMFDRLDTAVRGAELNKAAASALGVPENTRGPAQLVETINALATAIREDAGTPLLDKDIAVTAGVGSRGGDAVLRLKDGIELEWLDPDSDWGTRTLAQSVIAMMHDNLSRTEVGLVHEPPGCNVLYLDGHVTFVSYPGRAPITPDVAAILGKAND